jgi:catechol 2,3-dioxygenase-like lactoylglutathione lyase family enzyme
VPRIFPNTAQGSSNSNFPQDGYRRRAENPSTHPTECLMFNHISLGVHDVARSKTFYDAALAALGVRCLSASATSLGYGRDSVALWIGASERPVPADAGSGLHVCFDAPDRAAVDAFHRAALAHGGRDNGAPGLRLDYDPTYYAAFAIDPDGYRIEAYFGGKG